MDYTLSVIIEEQFLSSLKIEEVMGHWGDEILSYNPRRFLFDNIIELHEVSLTSGSNIQNLLIDAGLAEGIVITFDYAWLRILDFSMNQKEPDDICNNFKLFVDMIFQLKGKVSLLLDIDDELVGETVITSSDREAWDYLKRSFSWNNQRGILLIKE